MVVRTVYILALACSCSAAPDPVQSKSSVDSLRKWLNRKPADRPSITETSFAFQPLTRADADAAEKLLWADRVKQRKAACALEWKQKRIRFGKLVMKFDYRIYGEKPKDGWALFISMHGGGNARPEVNDQQWRNQIRLYKPKNAIYVAPRAPTNTWNLWHQKHIDTFFDRLIEGGVLCMGIDPNRVYIMGYSAGGDGAFQLAPRMADRWAAAAVMAGHPNETSPLGLRNIGFTIHMGALDSAYKRNRVAAQWKKLLDDLQAKDPEGYRHKVCLHQGMGHWMKLKDAVAVPWMARFTRNPFPNRVVWLQDDVTHPRFYWLAVPVDQQLKGAAATVEYKDQTVRVVRTKAISKLKIRLNDKMLDLDKPVTIKQNGTTVFNKVIPRRIAVIARTLDERGDPGSIYSAEFTIGGLR